MLIDTDVLIDLLRGNKQAQAFLSALPDDSPHACSVITVAELHAGMRENEKAKTLALIESLDILPVSKEIAELAGAFRQKYHSTRTKSASKPLEMELDDCLIAATAVTNSLELATRNTRHYPMPEVKIRTAGY